MSPLSLAPWLPSSLPFREELLTLFVETALLKILYQLHLRGRIVFNVYFLLIPTLDNIGCTIVLIILCIFVDLLVYSFSYRHSYYDSKSTTGAALILSRTHSCCIFT